MAIAATQASSYIGGEQGNTTIAGLGSAGAFEGTFIITCLDSTYEVFYYTPIDGIILYSVTEITNVDGEYAYVHSYNYVPKKQRNKKSLVPAFAFAFAPLGGGMSGDFTESWVNGNWGSSKYNYSYY